MDLKVLQEIGLTRNEAKVYLALLDLGSCSINSIADVTGKHRRTIYDCLGRLEDKGLVSYIIENKTRLFTADNPKRILDIIRDKEDKLKDEKTKVNEILPLLLQKAKETKVPIQVTVHKGKAGLKTIFEDIIIEKKEWLSLIYPIGTTHWRNYLNNFNARRIKAGIRYKVLHRKSGRTLERMREQQKLRLTEVRALPYEGGIPVSTWVFGNKVALMNWEAELGILIEGKHIADSFRQNFLTLWGLSEDIDSIEESDPLQKLKNDGDQITLNFDSLITRRKFIEDFEKKVIPKLKEKKVFVQMPHGYYTAANRERVKSRMKLFNKHKVQMFRIYRENTFLDKLSSDSYRRLGAKTKLGVKYNNNSWFQVYGDYILQTIPTKKMIEKEEKFFSSATKLDESYYKFMEEYYYKKGKVKLLVLRNKSLAKGIKDFIMSNFR